MLSQEGKCEFLMEVTDKMRSDVKVCLFEELFYNTFANMLFLLLDVKFSRSN